MRLKESKFLYALFGLIFVLVVGTTVVVEMLSSNKQPTKVTIHPSSLSRTKPVPTVQEVKKQEKKILEKEKKWIGSVSADGMNKKQNHLDLADAKGKKTNDIFNLPVPSTPRPVKRVVPDRRAVYKRYLWKYLFAEYVVKRSNPAPGGLLFNQSRKEAHQTAEFSSQSRKRPAPVSQQAKNAERPYSLYKPYEAVVETTIVSGRQKTGIFTAQIKRGVLKDWIVAGTAVPSYDVDRFYVSLKRLVSPEGKEFKVSGYVAGVNGVEGVVTYIKHEELPGMLARAFTKGLSDFFNAMREDSTTTVYAGNGVVVTTPERAKDRAKEATYSGLSSAMGETHQMVMEKSPKNEVLVLEKGTPVLVYFTN